MSRLNFLAFWASIFEVHIFGGGDYLVLTPLEVYLKSAPDFYLVLSIQFCIQFRSTSALPGSSVSQWWPFRSPFRAVVLGRCLKIWHILFKVNVFSPQMRLSIDLVVEVAVYVLMVPAGSSPALSQTSLPCLSVALVEVFRTHIGTAWRGASERGPFISLHYSVGAVALCRCQNYPYIFSLDIILSPAVAFTLYFHLFMIECQCILFAARWVSLFQV